MATASKRNAPQINNRRKKGSNKTMKEIELLTSPNHINPYLTHWTGRKGDDKKAFEILETIISRKQLKFGINRTSYPFANVKVKDCMISFTDTPIEHAIDHCRRYNYFGISFNKEKLIKYGANPVLYIVNNRKHHQAFFSDLKWRGMLPASNNFERNNLTWILSIMQPYKTRNLEKKGFPEYLEREWRIIRVLPSNLTENSIAIGGPYNEKFSGTISVKNEIKKGKNIETFFLNFNPTIIENIIVPNHYKREGDDLLKRNNLKCEIIVIKNSHSR
ncbi:MAG: hypothetical protein HY958_01535 [Bacteroidia bacterium]|nr:hypothetical protein [Bacteroidia bacterium]